MSENTNTATKQTWLDKALTVVENVCNKLPDPVILFCWLFLFTAIIGTIATVAGVSLINPASGEAVVSQNFFSADGLDWFLNNMVKNFTGFAPLGLVITMTLGIGLCEESGLIMSLLKGCLSDVLRLLFRTSSHSSVRLEILLPIPQTSSFLRLLHSSISVQENIRSLV